MQAFNLKILLTIIMEVHPMIPDFSGINHPLTRRSFLALSGAFGLALSSLSLPLPCDAAKFSAKLHKISMGKLGMGTFVNMTALHPSQDQAQEAMGRAYEEVDRLSALLSRHDPASPVSYLNRENGMPDLPPELLQVLKASLHYYKLSGGSFDITIQPVLDLYAKSFKATDKPPATSKLKQTMDLIGCNHLHLSASSVSFGKPEMAITLDSIAKGYIVDRAMDVLKHQGIEHALINAGGDIAVHGGKEANTPWRIAIQDPQQNDKRLDVVEIVSGSVATSGNYEVYFDREKVYHHIVSPTEGLPAKNTASVSIRAASTMEADALATAVFVMGPQAGSQFIQSNKNIEGLIVSREGLQSPSVSWG